MHGAVQRMIKSQGREYTIRNASGGGGRDTPSYSDDGTLRGVLEQRDRPTTVKDSSGEEIVSDLQIRAVDVDATIRAAGHSDGYPTKLVVKVLQPHYGSGAYAGGSYSYGERVYRVLDEHVEDAGVQVLTVVKD